MSREKYFTQYESPNVVIVPTSSASTDNVSTISTSDHKISTPCNMACCEYFAAQTVQGSFDHTANYMYTNNLSYFSAVYNHDNGYYYLNTTQQDHFGLTSLPSWPTPYEIQDTTQYSLANTQQIQRSQVLSTNSFQDYSYVNINPVQINDFTKTTRYPYPTMDSIYNNQNNNNKNDLKGLKENIDDRKKKYTVANTIKKPESNKENLRKTDTISKPCKEKNKEFNTKLVSKVTEKNGKNIATSKTLPEQEAKGKVKVLSKPDDINRTRKENYKQSKASEQLKYLWKRHCQKLKNKIKEEIEGSKEIRTTLHTEWKDILRSEYSKFVRNFYRSALIRRKHIDETPTTLSRKLKKKSATDLKNVIKNKQTNQKSLNNRMTKSKTDTAEDEKNKKVKQTPVKSIVQTPKNAYSHKHRNKSKDENVDLRTILSRKRSKELCYAPQTRNTKYAQKRPRERDNLIITVNQNIKSGTKPPVNTESTPKKKCKKIKLVINVVCGNSEDESSDNGSDNSGLVNQDLSFLDDFNVDDIVDSLNCNGSLDENKVLNQYNIISMTNNNNSVHKDTDEVLNEDYSNVKSEITNTEEKCEAVSAKGDINFDIESSLNGNILNNDVNATSISAQYSDMQKSTSKAFNNLDIKSEETKTDQACNTTLSTAPIITDQRIPQEIDITEEDKNIEALTMNHDNYNTNEEINDKKDEFLETIVEAPVQIVNVHETELIEQSNKANKIDLSTQSCKDTKSDDIDEKTEGVILSADNKISLDQIRKVDQTINTEKNPESREEIINSIENTQINEDISETVTRLVNVPEIHTEDEIIQISDDENSNATIIINVNDGKRIKVNCNNSLGTDKITENIGIKTTEENAYCAIESLITIDEIGYIEDAIEIHDTDDGQFFAKEKPIDDSQIFAKENPNIQEPDMKSEIKQDDKKLKVNDKKEINANLKAISNAKIIPKSKQNVPNKLIKNIPVNDKEFVAQLEIRMFDFLDDRYDIQSVIHRGKFSGIFKCADSKGQSYAIKVLNDVSERVSRGMLKEKMLMKLQKYIGREHLNIVYLFNSFGMMGYWCFLMEYYPKNLEQALYESKKCFHIDLVQALARQLVSAVTTLTNSNIIHTDIKPKHILLNSTNDKLKLCGFDDSSYIQFLDIKPNTGTASYRAPEIILGFIADFRIDVWATALVIFEMATGQKLFPGVFNNDILFKQMCTLGHFSQDMIDGSVYKDWYFLKGKFMRKIGFKGQKVVFIEYFKRNKRLHDSLFKAYKQDWESFATKQQVFEDRAKLNDLYQLLEQMLALDPRYRLPITFVGAKIALKCLLR